MGHWLFSVALLVSGCLNRVSAESNQVLQTAGDSLAIDIGDAKFTFRKIRSGTFMMGSPGQAPLGNERQHGVKISKDYFLQTTEVTQAQWAPFMAVSRPGCEQTVSGKSFPLGCVSWDDIQDYVGKLNAAQTAYDFRLPKEAEWEMAARCGSEGGFGSNTTWSEVGAIAWYSDNSDRHAHQVGSRAANECGLFDMHGNLKEWVADAYRKLYPDVSVDPFAPSGSDRVYRGGGFNSSRLDCRSAARTFALHSVRLQDFGFRLVVTKR